MLYPISDLSAIENCLAEFDSDPCLGG